MVGTKKKIQKKKVQSRQPVTDGHVSGIGSFPSFETTEMGKTTKKNPKIKVDHFEKNFKGVRLKNILAIGSEKKNSS